ncbi:NADPH-dependent FMN reductase [Bacillus sp. 1P06AnD]|uniref:NADPH-dependent FMN reductase n=1 Tax=Bacillus sp. 1P06AnD TaxID=3132208 RepID=UPI0039A16517
MKIIGISGSIVGTKTKIAMEYALERMREKHPDAEVELIDLGEYQVGYSDGRNYMDYEGDTKYVAETVMSADALLIGTPTFQASIPGVLKNVFDLLPVNAFRDKVAGIIATAGTPKHFLMAEQQLKPILVYMKATIVPTYVFIEEQDYHRGKIVNDDVVFRLDRLVDDTADLVNAMRIVKQAKEEAYDF